MTPGQGAARREGNARPAHAGDGCRDYVGIGNSSLVVTIRDHPEAIRKASRIERWNLRPPRTGHLWILARASHGSADLRSSRYWPSIYIGRRCSVASIKGQNSQSSCAADRVPAEVRQQVHDAVRHSFDANRETDRRAGSQGSAENVPQDARNHVRPVAIEPGVPRRYPRALPVVCEVADFGVLIVVVGFPPAPIVHVVFERICGGGRRYGGSELQRLSGLNEL